jgi:hypothetical protein
VVNNVFLQAATNKFFVLFRASYLVPVQAGIKNEHDSVHWVELANMSRNFSRLRDISDLCLCVLFVLSMFYFFGDGDM